VSYARPFSGNRGHAGARHSLPETTVPRAYLSLHRELIALRNNLLAHTDLPRRNPRVKSVVRTIKYVTFSGPDYEGLYRRADGIEALLTVVNEILNAELRRVASHLQDDE
jgi:hypothetical protein